MHKSPAKYLVLIESDGESLAKLYDERHVEVNDIDGASEEVAVMTRGLTPTRIGNDAPWAQVLAGHSEAERRAARVFTLDV